MKLRDIAIFNLKRRKSRAAFVLLGLIIGVASVVAMVGLGQALTAEVTHKMEKYGANILITPKSEQLSLSYEGLQLGNFSFETKELHQADLAALKTIKNAANIAAVGPVILGPIAVNNQNVLLAGMEFKSTKTLKPWWQLTGELPGPDQVILGSKASQILGLGIGDSLEVKDRRLTVSGILAPSGSQDDGLVFAHLPLAQDLLNKPGLVSMVEVAALCSACPVDDMVGQISGVLPGASVMAIQSVVKSRLEALKMFQRFAYGAAVLVILVGGLVVLVTMMASVRERTSEIGIFRAIGFRKSHVVRIVLIEAVVLSLIGGVVGFALGMAAGELALPHLAEASAHHMPFDPLLGVGALLLSLTVGLAASIYPALLAVRLDPVEALRSL